MFKSMGTVWTLLDVASVCKDVQCTPIPGSILSRSYVYRLRIEMLSILPICNAEISQRPEFAMEMSWASADESHEKWCGFCLPAATRPLRPPSS